MAPVQRSAYCYACGLWTQHKEDRPCTQYGCLGTLRSPLVQHSTIPFFRVSTDARIEDFRMVTRAVLALDELADKCNNCLAFTSALSGGIRGLQTHF